MNRSFYNPKLKSTKKKNTTPRKRTATSLLFRKLTLKKPRQTQHQLQMTNASTIFKKYAYNCRMPCHTGCHTFQFRPPSSARLGPAFCHRGGLPQGHKHLSLPQAIAHLQLAKFEGNIHRYHRYTYRLV